MWDRVKLEDICEVCGGTTPKTSNPEYWNGDNIWLSPVDLPEVGSISIVDSSQRKITDLGIRESGLRILPVGSLVFSTRASIGKIGIVNTPLTTNQGFTNLIPSERVNVRYLAYALKKNIPEIERLGNTTTFKEVSRTAIKNFKIPLPPLHIQEQIADTLDKADALRKKDQELLKKYDELAQSIFYDMFGDPVKNERGWVVKQFAEVGTLDRGVSKHRPRNAPELLGGPYPLIQTGDVSNCNGYIKKYTQTYSEIGFKQSKIWSKGTLCITIAANIAKTGILTFDACFPDSVVGFIPNNHVSINYVRFWLGYLQKTLEENAPESAQKNINLEILRSLKIPVPPKRLQDIFEEKLLNLNKSSECATDVKARTDQLFSSLLQKSNM